MILIRRSRSRRGMKPSLKRNKLSKFNFSKDTIKSCAVDTSDLIKCKPTIVVNDNVAEESRIDAGESFSGLIKIKFCYKPFPIRVEGLLTRGAMRAEDRPLWFDVYRAFPPALEPKFARPIPTQPIKQIFYPEDKIRAKFHAANHGLGAVNLLASRGETHTGRLIKQYQTLEQSGVPEDRLIEQSVASLTDSEPTVLPKKPRLAEQITQTKPKNTVDVKNIFNDQ